MEQSLQKEKYFSINGRKGTKRICRKEKLINKGINKENISELKGDSQKPDNLSEDVDGMSKDNTEQMLSIENFFKSYTPVEYGFKIFIKIACQTSIIDILKSQSAEILKDKNDDIYSKGNSLSQSESTKERKKEFKLCNISRESKNC